MTRIVLNFFDNFTWDGFYTLTKFTKKERIFPLGIKGSNPKMQSATNMNDLNALLIKGARLDEKYGNTEHKVYRIFKIFIWVENVYLKNLCESWMFDVLFADQQFECKFFSKFNFKF